ncbi:MAG: CAP domain-containing protein [Methanobacteriota archaeon]|nr:MAG: CAP domain-containing protein [Euryarchaeota archaeon]
MVVLLALMLLLSALSGCVTNTVVGSNHDPSYTLEVRDYNTSIEHNLTAEEKHMVDLINKVRKENNLSELGISVRASKLAREYANEMLSRGFFSHYDPEGRSVGDRAREGGLNYRQVGENLALVDSLKNISEKAIEGWLSSPKHRETMLTPEYNKVGVGIACSREEEKCYISSLYLDTMFNVYVPMQNDSRAVVNVQMNSPGLVRISGGREMKVMLTDRENLAKFKKREDYKIYGQWEGREVEFVMFPTDTIVVESDGSLNLSLEME